MPQLTIRDPQNLARLTLRQATVEAQRHELGGGRIRLRQRIDRVVECDEDLGGRIDGNRYRRKVDTLPIPAALLSRAVSRMIEKNATHRARSRREEVPAPLPLPTILRTDETQIRLVDERRRTERVRAPLVPHPVRGEATQFLVDDRKQLAGRSAIAFLDAVEHSRHVVHAPEDSGSAA